MIGFPPEPPPLRLQRLRPAPERPQHRSINKPPYQTQDAGGRSFLLRARGDDRDVFQASPDELRVISIQSL